MSLSIIIPAYNEEGRISEMLTQYLEYFRNATVEFIVVVNGSTDRTFDIARQFSDSHPGKLRVINVPEKILKGGAVRRGFREAKGDLIGFVDADNSTAPAEFAKLIRAVSEADGAIASRWKRGSEVVNRNWFRKLASFGFILLVKSLFMFPYVDTQCGAKLFKRQALLGVLDRLTVANMAFDVELLYRLRRAGYTVVEVPSRWVDKSSSAMLGSPLKFIGSALRMFTTLIHIRLTH